MSLFHAARGGRPYGGTVRDAHSESQSDFGAHGAGHGKFAVR